jgi:hypothetical protein
VINKLVTAADTNNYTQYKKEPSPLEIANRIRAIKLSDIKQIDKYSYEVKSRNKYKQADGVTYLVTFLKNQDIWFCTCNNFKYHNNEQNPKYECKHIARIRELITRQANRAGNKALKQLGDNQN